MENLNTNIETAEVQNLLELLGYIYDSHEKIKEITGSNFNIFSILNMESNEVSTHSRFIAELLNPKGKHGQKDIFLKKFIEYFNLTSLKIDMTTVNIYLEFYISKISKNYDTGGFIDILIRDRYGKVIMIENKIYAEDQPKQLLRYHRAFPNGKLFYLTLNGRHSSQDILSTDKYTCISYNNDIINWLLMCQKESADIPIVREAITQYINLIKKLTNQSASKIMEKEIIDLITSNSKYLKVWRTISDDNIQKKIKLKLLNYVLIKLNEHNFSKNNFTIIKTLDTVKGVDFQKKYITIVEFSNDILNKYGLKIILQFQQKQLGDLIFAIYSDKKNGKDFIDLFDLFGKEFENAKLSTACPAYIYYDNGYQNWYTNTLNDIVFDFPSFIDDLENKLNKAFGVISTFDSQRLNSNEN